MLPETPFTMVVIKYQDSQVAGKHFLASSVLRWASSQCFWNAFESLWFAWQNLWLRKLWRITWTKIPFSFQEKKKKIHCSGAGNPEVTPEAQLLTHLIVNLQQLSFASVDVRACRDCWLLPFCSTLAPRECPLPVTVTQRSWGSTRPQ